MKLNLISHNVQGLNSDVAVDQMRLFYSSKFHSLDMLCVQEHKLRGRAATEIGFKLWRQSKFFGCKASVGNQSSVRCGGIGIFVAPRIKHLISSQETVGVNQVQWIHLSGVPRGDLAVLNMYAPLSSSDRCTLWRELILALPNNCHWILCGDWNVVESTLDKSSLEPRIIADRET